MASYVPKGKLLLDAQLEMNLSSGAAFKPVSLAPDLWYGVTDDLSRSASSTAASARPASSRAAGDSLCFTGIEQRLSHTSTTRSALDGRIRLEEAARARRRALHQLHLRSVPARRQDRSRRALDLGQGLGRAAAEPLLRSDESYRADRHATGDGRRREHGRPLHPRDARLSRRTEGRPRAAGRSRTAVRRTPATAGRFRSRSPLATPCRRSSDSGSRSRSRI